VLYIYKAHKTNTQASETVQRKIKKNRGPKTEKKGPCWGHGSTSPGKKQGPKIKAFTNLFTLKVQMQFVYGGFVENLTQPEHLLLRASGISDAHAPKQQDMAERHQVIRRDPAGKG
jgi:hypothetical protein